MNLDLHLDTALRFLHRAGAKGASYDWYDHRAPVHGYQEWLFQYLSVLGIPENLHHPLVIKLARMDLIDVIPSECKVDALPPTQIKISFNGIKKVDMEIEKTLEYRILRYLEPHQHEFGMVTSTIVNELKTEYSPHEIEDELKKLEGLNILKNKDQHPFGWGYADGGARLNVLQSRIDKHKNELAEKQNRENQIAMHTTINTQLYVAGDNISENQSLSGNTHKSQVTQKTRKTNQHGSPKRSLLEILSWIFGIAIAIIGIYEFLVKKP